ncbi:MAG: N-acetyltransferase [Bacteroidia bacterium]|nr:N-acetyltransferase [Bacteroidia bacterium]
MLNIRSATPEDQERILEIYNEAVLNTTATFDTEPRSLEKQLKWFAGHGKNHPVFVAEHDGVIAGWSSLSPWSDRCAYDETVEVSVYVHPGFQGKGIGSRLLEMITLEGALRKNHTVLSRITEGNEASIHIHEKYGYRLVGVMKEVGFKFGKRLDVHLMQRVYPATS